MFSDDELLLIYGAVACVIVKRRKRQLKRNQWTKDWLLNRAQYSHVNLLKELRFHPKDWHNYLRMNEETFFSPKQLYELKNSLLQELIALTTQCNVKLRHLNIRGELADCDDSELADCDISELADCDAIKMEGEQNNEGPAPIFGPVEVDLHSSADTGYLGWSSPNTVEHEASTTDDRNSLENENEVSRVSSPVGVDRDEGLIAFMRTMMNSLNEKMDKNNEQLNDKMDKNNEELRDLNHKIDQNSEELKRELKHNYEELRTEMQRSNEQLKRDMEQMRDKELKNLEEGVRLELSEQAEKNKGERSKLKSQVRGEVTTEIKKLKDKREEDMREIEKRFVHIEDDKKKIDQRLEKLNKRFKTRLDELNGRVDRDRANLELDQDGENGKASKDVENKSITGSILQEIEDMGNRIEKSLNKRLDETLEKLENRQTELENMMRNQSMVGPYYNRDTYNRERVEFENDRRRQNDNRGRGKNDYGKEKERYENNETRHQRDQYEYTKGRGSMRVVKAVNLGIILGCDFLREHNAKINFEHGRIKLEVDKEVLNVEFTESNCESEDIVNGRSYPIPYSKREGVRKEIENMLKGDIIEESDSPYSNPLVKLRHLNICGELADCDVSELADCDVSELADCDTLRFDCCLNADVKRVAQPTRGGTLGKLIARKLAQQTWDLERSKVDP
ncbi:hypothetical protein J6590_039092 [Homalodisca vitripennis]|nr:hypothetical protein J6590_039092 [Homalodisca vitripennis]